MNGCRAGRALLQTVPRRTFVDSNNILPECFRIEVPESKDASNNQPRPIDTSSSTPRPSNLFDFQSLAAGGYNGLLAKHFEYGNKPQSILFLHDEMNKAGVSKNVTTYNYFISAYLSTKNVDGAYRQVYEMECRGLTPNVMTFEILMEGLLHMHSMGATIDELFELMQVKYNLIPSVSCWSARIVSWLKRKTEDRAIEAYELARKENFQCKVSSSLHTTVLKKAVLRRCWKVVDAILPNIRIGNFSFSNAERALVPVKDLADIWDFENLFEEESSPYNLELIRFLTAGPLNLSKGSFVRLLYYTASDKVHAPDLTEIAMNGIINALKDGKSDSVRIPAHFMEVYLAALRPRADSPPDRLPPAVLHKIKLFENALRAQK